MTRDRTVRCSQVGWACWLAGRPAWQAAPALGPHRVVVESGRARQDARRRRPRGRRLSARRAGAVPGAASAHALQSRGARHRVCSWPPTATSWSSRTPAAATSPRATSTPSATKARDGYDTVEWAAALPASDGKVGMFGGSYVGRHADARRRREAPAPRGHLPVRHRPPSTTRAGPTSRARSCSGSPRPGPRSSPRTRRARPRARARTGPSGSSRSARRPVPPPRRPRSGGAGALLPRLGAARDGTTTTGAR